MDPPLDSSGFGIALLRENPGPPDRPEREGRWPGGPGFYLGLTLFLVLTALARYWGPLGVGLLWGLALVAVLWIRHKRR